MIHTNGSKPPLLYNGSSSGSSLLPPFRNVGLVLSWLLGWECSCGRTGMPPVSELTFGNFLREPTMCQELGRWVCADPSTAWQLTHNPKYSSTKEYPEVPLDSSEAGSQTGLRVGKECAKHDICPRHTSSAVVPCLRKRACCLFIISNWLTSPGQESCCYAQLYLDIMQSRRLSKCRVCRVNELVSSD